MPLQRAAGRIKQLKAQRDNPLCLFLCNYNLMSAPLLPLPLGEVAERSEDGEGKLDCKALSY